MMLWWAAKGVFFCLNFITKYKFKLKQYTPTPSPARLYKVFTGKKKKKKKGKQKSSIAGKEAVSLERRLYSQHQSTTTIV